MQNIQNERRSFLRNIALGSVGATMLPLGLKATEKSSADEDGADPKNNKAAIAGRAYNSAYTGEYNNRIAFPLGGIGTGMFCVEGTGAISHMSLRHVPDVFHEPAMFAALSLPGTGVARVLEGPVPEWKKFGQHDAGLGGRGGATWGLPRFNKASFTTKFPEG